MHSNKYTFIYATVMTVIVAILLALSSEGLRPAQEANIAFEKRSNILSAVNIRNLDKKQTEAIYKKQIEEIVVDVQGNPVSGVKAFDVILKEEMEKQPEKRHLPLYIFTADDGKKYYIFPMFGPGLWGPLWGYISVEPDFNTVHGAFFDHKGETPGLGAEIASYEKFQQQFEGKKIFTQDNKFVSIKVMKKGEPTELEKTHLVDGISGGTITSKATDKMIYSWTEQYVPYFNKQKSTNP